MAFLTYTLIWTLFIVICAWLYYYFKRTLNFFKDLNIPYLPGWPILGNMGEPIFRRKHFSEVIEDIYNVDSEARYVGAFNFSSPVIVLRDPELIKSVSIKNFDNFPDHIAFVDDKIDPFFGGSLFNITGDKWKETRSLLTPAFTSSKMKAMYGLMVEVAENFINYIGEQSKADNKNVRSKELFTKFTNDAIATCAFGISVNTFKDPNNEFYVYGKEATNLEGIFALKLFLSRGFPKLIELFNVKFVSEKIIKFFTNVVSNTVQTRDEKHITRPDMIQLMMDGRGKENKTIKLDIPEMTAQAFVFFFGGFDTTSTQMCVLAHELAINPDVQKRLQEEIDYVLKETNGKPTYDAIHSMAYLDAVFNESVRLHTQAPFLDRLCRAPFELPPALPGCKPFTVKPGMAVWIPARPIHRDPKYYENPDAFDPDRYYNKKVSINDVFNLGFGIGPRSCIGNRFAMLEIKVLFFFLLSKYNLKPNEKTCSPLVYSKKKFGITPEGGFSLTIEPRF